MTPPCKISEYRPAHACGEGASHGGRPIPSQPPLFSLSCGGGPTRQGPDEQTEAQGGASAPGHKSQPEGGRAPQPSPPLARPLAGFSLPLRAFSFCLFSAAQQLRP